MGAREDAFLLLSEREAAEYRGVARHFRHQETGCEVLHVECADPENLFAFCFMTPPGDDTGVSHILEHSVLSGSRRYPLREPFSVLLKGSVQTFLNAFTYPDRTVYPAASCVPRDLFNLLDVYGDAVFFPLLRDETFRQEGWRLEGLPSGEPRLSGVVYNEMKGAMASADAVAGEWALRSLFPDTAYGRESGGDPRAIPSLTAERLRDYHRRWYHPSNCRIFLYGNIPPARYLAFLEERFLSQFAAAPIDSRIPEPAPWGAPRRLEKTYAVPPATATERRSTVLVSWKGPVVADQDSLLTMEVLAEALVGTPGSPLWKALIDSGLGEDLSPATGLETEAGDLVFSIGLRGTEPEKAAEVERVVLSTLSDLASRGLSERLRQSAINRIEFRAREIRGNGGPFALRLMRRALRGWCHGADPFESLLAAPAVERLRERLGRDRGLLESLVLRELAANLHRATVTVRPDPEQEARETGEEKERVAHLVPTEASPERERLLSEEEAFAAYQARKETPEELAVVPLLSRSDLSADIEIIPSRETELSGGARLLAHELFTNGIVYVDVCFPTAGLSPAQTLHLPLLGRAMCGSGVPGAGYAEVAVELQRLTGGFHCALDAGRVLGTPDVAQYMVFRLKALGRSLPEALDLVGSLLATATLGDRPRVRDLVRELRGDMKAALLPGGHQFAALRAMAQISAAAAVEERWRGVTQLEHIDDLAMGIETRIEALTEELARLRSSIVRTAGLVVNVTAEGDDLKTALAAIPSLCARLASGAESTIAPPPLPAPQGIGAESLATSAPVGYVSRAIIGFPFDDPRSPHAAVLAHLLSTGMLWDMVRREGGAYGAMAWTRPLEGLFVLGSYRDPRIARTFAAFRESIDRVARGEVEESELERAVVGTVGKEDRPLYPGEKGFVSLQRALHGISDEARRERRRLTLAMTSGEARDAAQALLANWERGSSVALASRSMIDEAAREIPALGERVREIPA